MKVHFVPRFISIFFHVIIVTVDDDGSGNDSFLGDILLPHKYF